MTLSTARALNKYECAVPALPQLGGDDLMPDLAEYMTSEEAAKALGFTSAKSVRNMVYKGKLEAIRFGRAVLVTRKSVNAYLEKTQGMNAKDPRRGRAY